MGKQTGGALGMATHVPPPIMTGSTGALPRRGSRCQLSVTGRMLYIMLPTYAVCELILLGVICESSGQGMTFEAKPKLAVQGRELPWLPDSALCGKWRSSAAAFPPVTVTDGVGATNCGNRCNA